MLHVPDTGPGKRVTGAGARTDGREASRQSSEVGAVCRKAARTVLCGGRPVMGIPTAIVRCKRLKAESPASAACRRQIICRCRRWPQLMCNEKSRNRTLSRAEPEV